MRYALGLFGGITGRLAVVASVITLSAGIGIAGLADRVADRRTAEIETLVRLDTDWSSSPALDRIAQLVSRRDEARADARLLRWAGVLSPVAVMALFLAMRWALVAPTPARETRP